MKDKLPIFASVFPVVAIALYACSEVEAARLKPIASTNLSLLLVQNRQTTPESESSADSEQAGINSVEVTLWNPLL